MGGFPSVDLLMGRRLNGNIENVNISTYDNGISCALRGSVVSARSGLPNNAKPFGNRWIPLGDVIEISTASRRFVT
jgi:hypothetical protein